MTNLNSHYKEISPAQTISNVQKFFSKNNLITKITESKQTEAGTWYCHIDLYSNNILILSSNGKGMTEDFSYASGFAELYERFCNRIGYFGHPIWAEDYMNRNKEKNGYYFHPDEKILSYDEALNSCNRIRNYFSFISKDIPSLKKKALDSIVQGKYVGVPMTCLDGSDKIFVDPRALLRVTRSGGMVA